MSKCHTKQCVVIIDEFETFADKKRMLSLKDDL
jgi:hypothetical protein